MKFLLSNQPNWEAGVKDKCLKKIQEKADLNNVNIEQLTKELLDEDVGSIPKEIE